MSQYKYFRVVLPDSVDTATVNEGFVDGRKVGSSAFSGALPGLSAASVAVNAGGSGYTVGDDIRIEGSGGTGALLNVDTVSTGVVTAVSVLEGGRYWSNASLTGVAQVSTTGAGTGFTGDITLTSETAGYDKERANVRWQEVIRAIQETGAFDVSDVTYTGGSEAAAPTQVEFTVAYNSDQVVWMTDLVTDPTGNTVYGPASDLDLGSFPSTITFTNAAETAVIERAIATALSQATFTDQREVFDATRTGGGSANTPTKPTRWQDISITQLGTGGTHALRMANIEGVGGFTVTQLDV